MSDHVSHNMDSIEFRMADGSRLTVSQTTTLIAKDRYAWAEISLALSRLGRHCDIRAVGDGKFEISSRPDTHGD